MNICPVATLNEKLQSSEKQELLSQARDFADEGRQKLAYSDVFMALGLIAAMVVPLP